MKKLVFMFAAFAAISLASCGPKGETPAEGGDSTAVVTDTDSTVVKDSTDSTKVEAPAPEAPEAPEAPVADVDTTKGE